MFNGITREHEGREWNISIQHLPDKKRPHIFVNDENCYIKVGEVTNEPLLMQYLAHIFHDAKVVE